MSNYIILDEQPTWEFVKPFAEYHSRYFPAIHVCKYYEDGEKRIDKVPDILETIDDEIDRLNDVLGEYKKGAISGTDVRNKVDTNLTPNDIKEAIQCMYEVRDEVLDSNDLFYAWEKPQRFHWYGASTQDVLDTYRKCARPIKMIKMEQLYRPVYDRTAEKWVAELDTRDEPKRGILIDDTAIYNRVKRDGKWIAVPFQLDCWATYHNFDEIVVAQTPEEIDGINNAPVRWLACEKCGRMFYYHYMSETYFEKGKPVPTMCRGCFLEGKKRTTKISRMKKRRG